MVDSLAELDITPFETLTARFTVLATSPRLDLRDPDHLRQVVDLLEQIVAANRRAERSRRHMFKRLARIVGYRQKGSDG